MNEKNQEMQTTSGQMYLDKDFSVELNYKLWVTKGSRFVASDRLKTISKLSSTSLGFLSSYMILLGLLSAFKLDSLLLISNQYLAFITTGLSIIILVFSQSESSSEYGLKSEKFHTCALEISDLYNKLRYLKTENSTDVDVNKLSQELSIEYGVILKRYENHKPIDYEYFKTSKPDYFELSRWETFKIKSTFYLKTKFLYHFLIGSPPVFIYFILR